MQAAALRPVILPPNQNQKRDKKAMLFHCKISTSNPIKLDDGTILYETRLRDASKPMALRTNGEIVMFLSEDVRKTLPSGDDIEDTEVTIHAREFSAGKNGVLKLKGQLQKGIVQPSAFGNDSGALPQRPQQPAKAAA